MNNTFNKTFYTDIERYIYKFPQPEGIVSVQEYLFLTASKDKLCILRLVNELDQEISEITFKFTQFDADGELLGTKKITYTASDFSASKPGAVFTPNIGIRINKSCSDIKVDVEHVICGQFIYRIKNGVAVSDYLFNDLWNYSDYDLKKTAQENRDEHKNKSKSIVSKLGFAPRMLPLSFLAVLLAVLFSILPYLEWFKKLF